MGASPLADGKQKAPNVYARQPLADTVIVAPLRACGRDSLFAVGFHCCALRFYDREGAVLVRKVVAIDYAVQNENNGTLVVWVDFDTSIHSTFSTETISFFRNFDIVTFIRGHKKILENDCDFAFDFNSNLTNCVGWSTETGVLVVNVNQRSKRFAHAAFSMYNGGMAALAKKCLHGKNKHHQSLLDGTEVDVYKMVSRLNCKDDSVLQKIALNDVPVYDLLIQFYDTKHMRKGWLHNRKLRHNLRTIRKYCNRTRSCNRFGPRLKMIKHHKNSLNSAMTQRGEKERHAKKKDIVLMLPDSKTPPPSARKRDGD